MKHLRQIVIWGVGIALIAVLSFSTGLAQIPRVTEPQVLSTSIADGATNICPNAGITANIAVPEAPGNGVNASTLNMNTVYLLDTSTSTKVSVTYNTTGGNDAFTITPTTFLKATTVYNYVVTSGLKDLQGNSFLPYDISFTTRSDSNVGIACGLSDFRFVRYGSAMPTNKKGKYATLELGPDNRLYASMTLANGTLGTPSGLIRIFDINGSGNLLFDRELTFFSGKALVGLAVDPQSTYNAATNPSGNIMLWVAVNNGLNYMVDPPHPESYPFSGMIYKLTGTNINTGSENWTASQAIIGLPRSRKDHLVNSLEFGPDGALYVNVGSMSAMGRDDSAWYFQPEVLLAAAVLRIDTVLLAQYPLPLNVKTGETIDDVDNPATTDIDESKTVGLNHELNDVPGGYYDPRGANAPLTIFATGIRNGYDLEWHSNGQLYVPTNGSAAGGRTPAYQSNNPACPNRINGQPYNGSTTVPQTANGPLQRDYLFRVVQGGYYGHPNPKRCEWVINGGNPTNGPDPAQFNTYPVGVQPDPNWRGFAHDFGNNASPNGIIEYQTNVYEGALRNWLLVVRYSRGDDIVLLKPGGDFNIDEDLTLSVENSTPPNPLVTLNNPLDVIEDKRNGNLYVSEYGGEETGSDGQIVLLKPKDPNAAPLSTNDLYTVNQGDTLTVNAANGVLANDSDLNGDAMTAVATTTLPLGLSLNPDGSITYNPDGSFTGTVKFSYRAEDSLGADGSVAEVTINVLPNGVTPTITPSATDTEEPSTPLPTFTPTPITPTETPTNTTTPPTATNTLDPLTPTSTLTPTSSFTPTDTSVVNLVLNGGFEAKDANLQPDLLPWTVSLGTSDVVKCNKDKTDDGDTNDLEDKIVAYEEGCAFQFRGDVGENSKLKQNVNALTPLANDTLTLRFYAKGNNVALDSADAQLKIIYTDGTKDKLKITLPGGPDGTFEYQEFVDLRTLTTSAAKLKLHFRYRSTIGKLRLDSIVVIVNESPRNHVQQWTWGAPASNSTVR